MRSDRTPLPMGDRLPRRPTDRLEDAVAWLLMAVALILVVAAGVTGFTVHSRQLERAEAENATRSPTTAVLLEDAPLIVGYGERVPVRAAARWTDRTGTEHTGVITTLPSMLAGSVVEVWLDDEGRAVDEPVQPSDAVVLAVAAAVAVLGMGGALLYALWSAVRSVTTAANDRRWEQEWEHVEPEWRDRHLR
jgi:uncharacterized protein HemX